MIRKSRKNVGLIGLGIIGVRVAEQLRNNGFHAYVWSRSPQPVPNFLSSAAEVADVCPIIQIFVSDDAALLEIIRSLTAVLTDQHLIICSATVGLEATLEAAKIVQAHGAKFLDAPFTGSKDAAANGQLVYFIGGDDDTLAQAEPVLQASSKQIVRVGKIGDAAVVKIATNMIAASTVQTLAEALAIIKAAGLDPAVMTSVIEYHGARSALLDQKLATILSGNFEPNFTLRHMLKDVNLGLRIASAHDLYLPATSAASIALTKGVQQDWADLDYAAVAKTFGLGERPLTPEIEEEIEPKSAPEPEQENAELSEPADHLSTESEPPAADSEPLEPVSLDEKASEEPAAAYEPAPADSLPDEPAVSSEAQPEPAMNANDSDAHPQPAAKPPTPGDTPAPSLSDLVDSQPIPAIPPRAVRKPHPEEDLDDDAFRTTMKLDLDSFRTTMKLDDESRTTMKLGDNSLRSTEKIVEPPEPRSTLKPVATPIAVQGATPRHVEGDNKTAPKRTPIQVHVPEDRDVIAPQKKRGFFSKLFSKKDLDDVE